MSLVLAEALAVHRDPVAQFLGNAIGNRQRCARLQAGSEFTCQVEGNSQNVLAVRGLPGPVIVVLLEV